MGTDNRRQGWINGGVITGATLLFLNGVFSIFTGIAGFVRRTYFNATGNYPYNLSSYGWGWIYVVLGSILVLTSLYLLTGSRPARAAALFFLVLSAVANFFFVPFHPFWALLMLAVDFFAIWAIANARGPGALGGEQYEEPRTGARQQPAMTSQGQQQYQPTGGQQRQMAGAGSQQRQPSAYQGDQQRWPQNAQGRGDNRQYAAGNVKAPDSLGGRSADAMRDQMSQSQQSGGMPQTAEQAAQQARQASRGNNQGS
jgi:hypothetical protein